ncbi:DUF2516 family protein [Nocardioides sp. Root190]|uniref:DUF2516 family protein n=1 Tax=Nocardioides sp. Root190 TaxID=1736488 RepID=UPI0009EB7962|nr:DUF2516 family protein [Nocardioides sp. Root190]
MGGGFVPAVSDAEMYINLGIAFALLVLKIFALVSALLYSAESYSAADKLTKVTWCALLGVGAGLQLFLWLGIDFSIVNLAMTVAAAVYLADVRPALAGLRRR